MEPAGPGCPESRRQPGSSPVPNGGGQPKQASWDDAKAFYENLSPKKKPKSPRPQHAITIAVSSRALFRMEEEQKIYQEQGVEAYVKYQLEHENEPFLPGAAFPFLKALESVNSQLRELFPDSEELFDIVLVTNNHAQVGVRLINSINHYSSNSFSVKLCTSSSRPPPCRFHDFNNHSP